MCFENTQVILWKEFNPNKKKLAPRMHPQNQNEKQKTIAKQKTTKYIIDIRIANFTADKLKFIIAIIIIIKIVANQIYTKTIKHYIIF